MMKYRISLSAVVTAITLSAYADIITPAIERDYQDRLPVIEKAMAQHLKDLPLSAERRDALKMLYS